MPKKIETKVVKRTKIEREMTLLRAIERVVDVVGKWVNERFSLITHISTN